MRSLSIILACNFNGGIGYQNKIPWNIPQEMKKFKDITTSTDYPNKRNAVIMGRKTWLSLQGSLPNRLNIIVTSKRDFEINDPSTIVSANIEKAINICNYYDDIDKIFIIGGSHIYDNVIKNNYLYDVKQIFLSVIFYDKENQHEYDTYINMENILKNFTIQKDIRYSQYAKDRLFASYICLPKCLE
jgi:dihydrofolate reductase